MDTDLAIVICPQCSQSIEIDPDAMQQLRGQPSFACPNCRGEVPVPLVQPLPLGVAPPVTVMQNAMAPPAGQLASCPTPEDESVATKSAAHSNRAVLILSGVLILTIGGVAVALALRERGKTVQTTTNLTYQTIQETFFNNLIASGVTSAKRLDAVESIRPYGTLFVGLSREMFAAAEAEDLARKTGATVLDIDENQPSYPKALPEWIKSQFAEAISPPVWVKQAKVLRSFNADGIVDSGDAGAETSHRVLLGWQGPEDLLAASESPVLVLETVADEEQDMSFESRGGMTLDESTRLEVDQLGGGSSAETALGMRLQTGRVFYRLNAQEDALVEVRVRAGKVGVEESGFFLEMDGADTLVAVRDGSVVVRSRAKPEEKIKVSAGYMAKITLTGVNHPEQCGDRETNLFTNIAGATDRFPPHPGVPWDNALGMRFCPVAGIEGVLFSIWETRVQDYEAYASVNPGIDGSWRTAQLGGVPIGRESDHPVTMISWDDANAFCAWLTQTDQAAGRIRLGDYYRLPTVREWYLASGSRDWEGAGNRYPWGSELPPPVNTGNLADETASSLFPQPANIDGYEDGYATTAPVGTFRKGIGGLYDMVGNVMEWCEDPAEESDSGRKLKGASWVDAHLPNLWPGGGWADAGDRRDHFGFRCVLDVGNEEYAWASLIDRETLNGWQPTNPSGWRVEDGAMISDGSGARWIFREIDARRFELIGEFRVSAEGNGGVFFHCDDPTGRSRLGDPVRSPELQLVGSAGHNLGGVWTGGFFGGDGPRGDKASPPRNPITDDNWASFRLVVDGSTAESWISGEKLASFANEEPLGTSNYIALQALKTGGEVGYRNLKIRPLPEL